MAKSADQAAENYRRGVDQIGVDTYKRAARTSSPSEAAEILEGAAEERLSLDTMVSNYRSAY